MSHFVLPAMKIHLTQRTCDLLQQMRGYLIELRGHIQVEVVKACGWAAVSRTTVSYLGPDIVTPMSVTAGAFHDKSVQIFQILHPHLSELYEKWSMGVLLGSEDDCNNFRPLRAKLFELSRKHFLDFM